MLINDYACVILSARKVSDNKNLVTGGWRKEVSVALRDLIIKEREDKENGPKSLHKIADLFKLSKSTVRNIITKYRRTGMVENLKGRGRKQVFTTREAKQIARKVTINPMISSSKLSEEVRRTLAKMFLLKPYIISSAKLGCRPGQHEGSPSFPRRIN
jgi:predicted transcriptional regulator